MGVKVRVKRNIGKNSEEYFGLPNGKVYELTDNFRLVDDGVMNGEITDSKMSKNLLNT